MSSSLPKADASVIFRLSCWAIGAIAFLQLLVAGVALAVRVENAREVRIEERIVTKIVNVAAPAPQPEPAPPVVALPPPPPAVEVPLPPARPLAAPPIADPVVERLVKEARKARVAEDMGSAMAKLDEARHREPQEPNVLYEYGLLYETMASFDTSLAAKAAEAYQEVFELGTDGAGALYPLAAAKLRDGITRPVDMRGKLSLGRVWIFKDDAYPDGERVVLTIPIRAAPGAEPASDDFFVKTSFFYKTPNEEPQLIGDDCETEVEWVSGAIDWLGGEETLRVTYRKSHNQDHLFGNRSYYGQVVELFYKNELIDSQPWPRHLASHMKAPPGGRASMQAQDPLFLDSEMFPEDFDPNLPLLPPLEGASFELPPFPER